MPYKNIVFTKLMVELAHDERFTDQCDDAQKLLYFGLLLLAGVTNNAIPNNANYIKRNLNLGEKVEKITQNLEHLISIFPKLYIYNGFLKFKNWKKLHNYVGKTLGKPKDLLGFSKNRREKIKNRIRIEKNWDDRFLSPSIHARINKSLNTLWEAAGQIIADYDKRTDAICQAIGWVAGQGYVEWTTETVVKKWADFMVKGYKSEAYRKMEEEYVKSKVRPNSRPSGEMPRSVAEGRVEGVGSVSI